MSTDNSTHGINSYSNTVSSTIKNSNTSADSSENSINDDPEISIADFNPLAKLEKSTITTNNTNNHTNSTSNTYISNDNGNGDTNYNDNEIRKNRESKISIISTDSISSTGRLLDKLGLDDEEEEEEEDVDDLYYPNNYSNNDSNNIDNSYNNSNPNASFNSQKSEPANKFKSLRNILLFNKTNENKDSAIETAIAMGSKIHTVNSSKSIKTGFHQNKRKSIHAELTSNKSSDEISNIKSNQDYDINDIFNNNNNINNNNINNNNHSNNNNYNNAYYNTEFRKFIPSHQKNNESISTLLDSSFNNDDQELLQNSSYNESFEIQDDDESLQNDGDLFLSNNSHNNLVDNIDPRSRSDSRADSITDSITDSISDSRSFEFGDETKDDNIATDTDNTLYKIVTPLNYNKNFRDLNNSSMTFDSHKNNLTRDLKINIYNFEKEKDRQFDNHSHSLSNTVDLNSLTRKPHTKGLRSPLAKSFHQGFHHQTAPQNYVANVVDEVPNSPVSKKSILSTSSSSSNPESAFSSSALPISSSPSSSASYIENSNHNNQRQTYKDQQQLQQQLQQRYRKLHSHQLSNSSVPEQIHREYHQMALFKQMSPSSARSVNTSHSHTSSQSSTTSSIDRIDSKFDSLNSKTDSLTNSIYTSNSISSSDNGNNTINNIPPPRLNQISRTSSNSSLNKHIRQSHSFSNSEFSPFDNPDPPFNNEIVFNTPPSTPSSLSSFSQPPINNNYAHHSHHKSMPVPVHQYMNQEQPKHQQQFSQHAIQRPTTSGHTRDQTHFTPFKPHSTISNNWDQSPASSFSQPTVTTAQSPQSGLPGKVASHFSASSHFPATGHFPSASQSQAYIQPQATSQPAAGPTGDLNNSQRTSKCPTYETF